MDGGFLLDVVVRDRAGVFELLSSVDESLLVAGDALFVEDLGLEGFNRLRGLDFESHGSSSEGFDEDLHCFSLLIMNCSVREYFSIVTLIKTICFYSISVIVRQIKVRLKLIF